MALWKTSPTVTASTSAGKDRVSSRAKKAHDHRPTPTAPTRYTGFRPIRSESAPNSGIRQNCTAEPISTALSDVCLSISRWLTQ